MMNYKIANTLVSYKNSVSNNLAYVATAISGGYLIKTLFSAFTTNLKNKSLDKKIKEIIELEEAKRKEEEKFNRYIRIEENNSCESQVENTLNNKTNFTIVEVDNSNEFDDTKLGSKRNQTNKASKKLKRRELEFFYLVYLKCLKTIYSKEISDFENSRRSIFKEGNLFKYINFVEKWNSSFKEKENYLFKVIEKELKMDENTEREIKIQEINVKNVNKKYYEDLEIDLPNELNNEKMNEILLILFTKTKEYMKQIEKFLNLRDVNDDEYLIAENMAFDYVYSTTGYEENQIRKAIVAYNLNFEVQKNISN